MSPFHHIGEALRSWLMTVPLPAVRLLFTASLLILIIWVLRLPREVTTPAAVVRRWDENLKVGAVAALLVQIIIYSFF